MDDRSDPPVPRRKRLSREEGKALTRARLLESARSLIARKGYEGATIDEMAEEAGFSRGAFYSNFRNKEELMAELIRTGFDGDIALFRSLPAELDRETVSRFYLEFSDTMAANPENLLWMLEFQLAVVRHPELRAGYSAQFLRLRNEVTRLIDAMFPAGDTGRFADLFIVVQTGLAFQRLLDPERVNAGSVARAFDVLMQGLGSGGRKGRGVSRPRPS